MKIAFMATGIAVLVFALNLLFIYFTIKVTSQQEKPVRKQITRIGISAMIIGILVIAIGIPVRLFGSTPIADIISGAGGSVVLMGGYTAVRANGHDSVSSIKNWAWAIAGLGVIFVILGLIT